MIRMGLERLGRVWHHEFATPIWGFKPEMPSQLLPCIIGHKITLRHQGRIFSDTTSSHKARVNTRSYPEPVTVGDTLSKAGPLCWYRLNYRPREPELTHADTRIWRLSLSPQCASCCALQALNGCGDGGRCCCVFDLYVMHPSSRRFFNKFDVEDMDAAHTAGLLESYKTP